MKIKFSRSFSQLFLMNLRLLYRNPTGMFFSVAMPVVIYVGLSVLPFAGAFNTGVAYSSFVLPGIIALTVMQGGIYGLAYWMIDLRTRGVVKRFLVTPIRTSELMLSVISSRVLLALLQVVFLTALGVAFFGVVFSPRMLLVLPLAVLGSAIFLIVGLLVARIANSYEAAAPITTAVGLPLTFLGNIFIPLKSLPNALQIVGKLLPITYLADGMRLIFLGPIDFRALFMDILVLLVWLVALLLLALWQFRLKE